MVRKRGNTEPSVCVWKQQLASRLLAVTVGCIRRRPACNACAQPEDIWHYPPLPCLIKRNLIALKPDRATCACFLFPVSREQFTCELRVIAACDPLLPRIATLWLTIAIGWTHAMGYSSPFEAGISIDRLAGNSRPPSNSWQTSGLTSRPVLCLASVMEPPVIFCSDCRFQHVSLRAGCAVLPECCPISIRIRESLNARCSLLSPLLFPY